MDDLCDRVKDNLPFRRVAPHYLASIAWMHILRHFPAKGGWPRISGRNQSKLSSSPHTVAYRQNTKSARGAPSI